MYCIREACLHGAVWVSVHWVCRSFYNIVQIYNNKNKCFVVPLLVLHFSSQVFFFLLPAEFSPLQARSSSSFLLDHDFLLPFRRYLPLLLQRLNVRIRASRIRIRARATASCAVALFACRIRARATRTLDPLLLCRKRFSQHMFHNIRMAVLL